jgi:hypothetical protein
MTSAPKHVNGVPLIRGGVPALSDDCCCTPSCYPNVCLLDPRALCCRYYCADADECKRINSFEINISGVGGSITCPSTGSGCCYAFDCECDLFNSTFIHEHAENCDLIRECISRWTLRGAAWNGADFSDSCNIPPTFACGNWVTTRTVYVETGFANYQKAFVSGTDPALILPGAVGNFGTWYVCNNYTLVPGHYIVVILRHSVTRPFNVAGYVNEKFFIYPFANGAKRFVDCADDNHYPLDNFIGGDAVLFASRRLELFAGNVVVPYLDCDDWDYTCQLSDATVTVEPPDIELCEDIDTEDPPSPP